MTEAGKAQSHFPIEDSIPKAADSLESILCTEELHSRPPRPPDYEKENRALVKLGSALADSPRTIFQTLADTILDIRQCDSAGLSLLTKDGKTPDVAGEAVGTIWAIMHSDRRRFDAEDDRVMASLGKFASSAYQALKHIEDLKIQVAEREKAEAEVRELAKGL